MRGCPVITVWDRGVASTYMRLYVLVHLFLERGQYVSGLKGHKYDLDSCMSVHLLENCPLLDSLKPMEQAFPSIALMPVSENLKGETNVATVSLCNSSLERKCLQSSLLFRACMRIETRKQVS